MGIWFRAGLWWTITLVNMIFVTIKFFSVSNNFFTLNSNMFLVFLYHSRFLSDIQL
jgi:hypothetical protein